jgi:hypothetical protein
VTTLAATSPGDLVDTERPADRAQILAKLFFVARADQHGGNGRLL